MQLRPHHLLCTQSYIGKGYSLEFVKNMDEITQKFRTESQTEIELTFSPDCLCTYCPNHTNSDWCNSNEKVKEMDQKAAAYFHLEERTYIYQDLIKEIREIITPEILKDICGNCEWYSNSPCKEKIIELR